MIYSDFSAIINYGNQYGCCTGRFDRKLKKGTISQSDTAHYAHTDKLAVR